MVQSRAYAVDVILWTFRVGRVGYCSQLRGVGLHLVERGRFSDVWVPIGLGLFWRQRRRAWVQIYRKDDIP